MLVPLLIPGKVALTVVIAPCIAVAVLARVNPTLPETSQSPAVREMLVRSMVVPVVRAVPDCVAVTNSPTDPADALLLVVVPMIPAVWLRYSARKGRATVPRSQVVEAARMFA
jgi:hypothetical protein